MVFFTCQRCNESLKKNAVEKHLTWCKKPSQLTCIDCLKDFDETTYNGHNQCVTEDERYGGANYVPKQVAKKQTSWIDVIRSASERRDLTPLQKKILNVLADAPNVPRKHAPFKNFCQTNRCLRTFNTSIVLEVFEILNEDWKKAQASNSEATNNKEKAQSEESRVDQMNPESKMTDGKETHKKKKKNKKQPEVNDLFSNESSVHDGSANVEESSDKSKKKKKKKKSNNMGDVDESNNHPECNKGEEMNAEEVPEGKKKKKRKNKGDIMDVVNDSNNQPEINEEEETSVKEEEMTVDASLPPEMSHLSKKERKKLLKQMKYEAELKAIETAPKVTEVSNGGIEEDMEKVKDKKKSKKRKAQVANGDSASFESKPDETEPKKPKLNGTEETNAAAVPEASGKFNWQEVITRVLKASDDNELPLKRLYKKVINEFTFQCGEREDYDKLLGKCSKKVQKTPGIRVLKDKARLIQSC